ncbi:hypothetical protein B484DRAFT_406344 [Ochromonadaceae sp. CCMP2298]|nr:hypothetical protein B484DRAFT_406344 [Ochromonadaceae sp. CCMP2298]
MLRLALWPTEKLWVSVGKELTRLAEIPAGHKGDRQRQRRRLQTEQPKQQRLFDHRQQQQNGTQPHLVRSSARLQEAKTETGGGGAEVEVGTTALTAAAASYTASATSDTGAGTVALPLAVFMVGMHYRCGDNSYIHKGGYDHMCTWEANPFEQKAPMYRLGNPQQIGLCAKETIAGLKGDNTPLGPIIGPNTLTLGLVASDNVPASLQMRQALGLSRSIVSSEGCQSAMDPSAQCHESTATQWFVLALCDVLVTQENMPSGFSRSAGIYGLRYDPFRNALNCEQPQNNSHHSHSQHANWFC